MANEKRRLGNRDLLILFFLISVLAIISYFVLFGFIFEPGQENFGAIAQNVIVDSDLMRRIIGLNLDFNFLRDRKFSNLIKYGQLPIVVEEKGRANPFEPY